MLLGGSVSAVVMMPTEGGQTPTNTVKPTLKITTTVKVSASATPRLVDEMSSNTPVLKATNQVTNTPATQNAQQQTNENNTITLVALGIGTFAVVGGGAYYLLFRKKD